MHKSKLAVTLGTVVALSALTMATPASASTSTSNSGGAVTRSASHAAPASVDKKGFKPIDQPGMKKYTKKTCAIDLSAIADFTIVSTLKGCGQKITLTPSGDKRSVPGSWGTWGSPPNTESATPNLIYSNAATTFTLKFSKASKIGGVEAEPNPFEVHAISAAFSNGAKNVGTVTRDSDGSSGAVLYAAKSKKTWDTLTLSSDVDFAFAQIRVSK